MALLAPAISSGANGVRSCLGWPGCAPRLRFFRFPPFLEADAWGFTTSEDGGFDEFREFFSSFAKRASSSATRASSTTQFGHRALVACSCIATAA